MKWLMKRYRLGMKSHNRILFLLDSSYKLIFILLILPLFNLALDYIMKLWGQSYITVGNLRAFLTYWPALLLLFASMFFLSLYTFLKLATLLNYTLNHPSATDPSIPALHIQSISLVRRLFHKNRITLLIYSSLFYLFLNLPTLIGYTVYLKLPPFHWGGASDHLFMKGLIILGLIFYGFAFFQSIFTLHSCIHNNKGLRQGLRNSRELLRTRGLKTALCLLLYNLSLFLIFYLVYRCVLTASALLVYIFTEKQMVISVFLSIYPKINFYILLLFGTGVYLTNLNIISTLYVAYLRQENRDMPPEMVFPNDPIPSNSGYRHITYAIFIFVIAFGVFNFYHTIRYDSFHLQKAFVGIEITAHRGNTLLAPENTLPALDYAIEAHSDAAEIDIQQTKDGILILMHDCSLKRITGVNQEVGALSLREIKQLDAGAWFSHEFIHTPIPTLEEALKLCRGRIQLILDIKVYHKTQGLEEALVALIEQYDFENQCLISSTDHKVLKRVKALNPNIKTGLILSTLYGNYFEMKFIDYYSIRSPYITKSEVDNAHRQGKEIHAWTVNTISEIERMKSLGVDSIITDNPILTREVLYRDDTTESFINLLNRMLKHRSFYQLVQFVR